MRLITGKRNFIERFNESLKKICEKFDNDKLNGKQNFENGDNAMFTQYKVDSTEIHVNNPLDDILTTLAKISIKEFTTYYDNNLHISDFEERCPVSVIVYFLRNYSHFVNERYCDMFVNETDKNKVFFNVMYENLFNKINTIYSSSSFKGSDIEFLIDNYHVVATNISCNYCEFDYYANEYIPNLNYKNLLDEIDSKEIFNDKYKILLNLLIDLFKYYILLCFKLFNKLDIYKTISQRKSLLSNKEKTDDQIIINVIETEKYRSILTQIYFVENLLIPFFEKIKYK